MYVCMYVYIYYITLWFHVISWDFQVSHSDPSGFTHHTSTIIYQFSGIGNRNQPENGFTISQAAKFIAKSTTKNRDSLKNPTIQP